MKLTDYLKKKLRKKDSDTDSSTKSEGRSYDSRMLSLEPRIVFDAAGASEFVDTTSEAESADTGSTDQTSDASSTDMADPASLFQTEKEILIIDSHVVNYESLIPENNDFVEVIVLNDQQDGIQQISQALQNHDNITGLHILSHGSEGAISLAGQQIHSENLSDFSQQLQSWSESLTSDADILLYGCDVGADNEGLDFINSFSDLTGADIAASDDITGSELLGGDIVLEQQTGEIETEVFLDYDQVEHLDFVLSSEPPSSDIDFRTGDWSNGVDSSITNTIDGVDVTVTTPGKPVGQGSDGVGSDNERVSFGETIDIHFSKNGENIDVLLDQVDITNLFKKTSYGADNEPLKITIETLDGEVFEYYLEAEDDQIPGTQGDKIVDIDVMAHKISIEVVRDYIHFTVEGLSFIENPTPAQVNDFSEVSQAIDFRDIYKWGESTESYQEHFSRTQNGVEVAVTSALAQSWVYQRGITIHNVDGLGVKGHDSHLYLDQEEFIEIEFNKNGVSSPVNVDQIDLRQMDFNGADNDAGTIIVTTVDGTEHSIDFESTADDISKQKVVDINIDGVTKIKFVTDTAGSEFTVQRIVFSDDYDLPQDHYAGETLGLDFRNQFWTGSEEASSIEKTVADLVDVNVSSSTSDVSFDSTYGIGSADSSASLLEYNDEVSLEFNKDNIATDVYIKDIDLSHFTSGEPAKIIIEDVNGNQTEIDVTASGSDSHETIPIDMVGHKVTIINDGEHWQKFGVSGINFETLVAEPANIDLNDVTVSEDQSVDLNITLDLPTSDTTIVETIVIENVPQDAALSTGTNLGNGIWEFTAAELEAATLTPAENFSGEINLTVKTVTQSGFDTNEVTQNLQVTVNAVADQLTMTSVDVQGAEDQPVALNLSVAVTDTSETISQILIENVPEDASLNNGANLGNGVWSLSEADLSNLELIPADHFHGDMTLTFNVTNTDENGDQQQQSQEFEVSIASVNDAPEANITTINLPDALEDQEAVDTILISDLVQQAGSDVETAEIGIAIGSLDQSIGKWVYAEGPDETFQEIPEIAENNVFLLGPNAQLQFISDTHAHGNTSIDFYLWDQHTGEENTAFSTADLMSENAISEETVTVEKNIISVNDVVNIENDIQLGIITAKEPNSGQPIDSFIQDHILNDIEQDFGGIAIIADFSESESGQWEFSNDGGDTWQAIESPSESEPIILEKTDHIRFAFDKGFDGEPGQLVVKAWDGNPSSPDFSANSVNIDISIDNPQLVTNFDADTRFTGTITSIPAITFVELNAPTIIDTLQDIQTKFASNSDITNSNDSFESLIEITQLTNLVEVNTSEGDTTEEISLSFTDNFYNCIEFVAQEIPVEIVETNYVEIAAEGCTIPEGHISDTDPLKFQ